MRKTFQCALSQRLTNKTLIDLHLKYLPLFPFFCIAAELIGCAERLSHSVACWRIPAAAVCRRQCKQQQRQHQLRRQQLQHCGHFAEQHERGERILGRQQHQCRRRAQHCPAGDCRDINVSRFAGHSASDIPAFRQCAENCHLHQEQFIPGKFVLIMPRARLIIDPTFCAHFIPPGPHPVSGCALGTAGQVHIGRPEYLQWLLHLAHRQQQADRLECQVQQ